MCFLPKQDASASRLWQGGWETGGTNEHNATVTFGSSASTVTNANMRTGDYCLTFSSPTATTRTGAAYSFASSNNDGPFWLRTYWKWDRLSLTPTQTNTFWACGSANLAATVLMWKVDNSARLLFYTNNVFFASGPVVNSNEWTLLEMKFRRSAGAGEGIFYVNSVEQASATGVTFPAGIQGLNFGINLATENNTGGRWYFDDAAINDSSGTFQTNLCGEGKIVHLRPNGNDGATTWEIGGTSPAASNVDSIDEINPDDAITYNMSSNNANSVEEFLLTDTTSEIGASDTINTVAVAPRYAGANTTDSNKSLTLRIKSSAGGTTETGSAGAPPNAIWRTYNRAGRNYTIMTYDLPGASTTPWTKSDLDTAVAGYSLNPTGSNTGSNLVSTLWMSIDFTPVIAPSSDGEPEGLLNIFP